VRDKQASDLLLDNQYHWTKYSSRGNSITMTRQILCNCNHYGCLPNKAVVGTVWQLLEPLYVVGKRLERESSTRMGNFVTYSLHKTLLGKSCQRV
jgi:hypothetical protein